MDGWINEWMDGWMDSKGSQANCHVKNCGEKYL